MLKRNYPFLLVASLILIVCLVAYGQIIRMYFFLEDYLILYSIQRPDSPDAGYGSGVFGRPYGYAVTPFIPFYYLFGLEPKGYYLVEVILYFLAALVVYFFAKTLTNNRLTAFGSSLIFASGYVGSESLYRMAVGWQNLLAAIFISVTCAIYYKFVRSSKIGLYFLALAFYIFTSEFSFYRAHGILLLILGIELLFNFRLKKILFSIIRLVPFVASYLYFYVYSLTFMDQGSKFSTFFQKIITERSFHFLLNLLKTLENVFIPDKFGFPLLIFIAILFSILVWKRSKILIFCLLFIVANYLVHFYNSPANFQETTHRYLTVSFIGASIFWGVFLSGVFKSVGKYLFFCLLIVVLNLILVRKDQANIIQNRSEPTRFFWQSFKNEVKDLPQKSAVYIDSRQDGISKPARDAALSAGSMSATTSFAVNYGLKWQDIYLAENFSELLDFVRSGKVNQDNIYTFFYSRQTGLVNTTQGTKTALLGKGNRVTLEDLNNINVVYSSPVLLTFSSEASIDFSEAGYSTDNSVDLARYFAFLSSRERYWKKVAVSATSEVKYAEIHNILDRKIETSWKPDPFSWQEKHKEEIILDLGEIRQIGGIRIIPASFARAPTKYLYECSVDRNSWEQIADFEKKIDKTEPIIDKFGKRNCAFIRITIYNTSSHDPPQISEIEVLEDKFVDLDISLAEEIEKDPFKFMRLPSDKQILSNYFANNGINGQICIYTDKYKQSEPLCKKYKFRQGRNNNGSLLIDPGGTLLQKIEFLLPSHVKLSIKNAVIEYLSFESSF